jgi:hypothetical protein
MMSSLNRTQNTAPVHYKDREIFILDWWNRTKYECAVWAEYAVETVRLMLRVVITGFLSLKWASDDNDEYLK